MTYDLSAIPRKDGKIGETPAGIEKVNMTMQEAINSFAVLPKGQRYAKGRMGFEQACIGTPEQLPSYSMDSAHVGGKFFETTDGKVFRLGVKGIEKLSANNL